MKENLKPIVIAGVLGLFLMGGPLLLLVLVRPDPNALAKEIVVRLPKQESKVIVPTVTNLPMVFHSKPWIVEPAPVVTVIPITVEDDIMSLNCPVCGTELKFRKP